VTALVKDLATVAPAAINSFIFTALVLPDGIEPDIQ
jgi:hypothetical protein